MTDTLPTDLAALADRLADVAEDYRFVIPQFHAQNRRKMKARADTLDNVIDELRALASRDGGGCVEIVRKHRRHVELSPGVGSDAQTYALAVIDDILADLPPPAKAAPLPGAVGGGS